jgi:hypothetical protein
MEGKCNFTRVAFRWQQSGGLTALLPSRARQEAENSVDAGPALPDGRGSVTDFACQNSSPIREYDARWDHEDCVEEACAHAASRFYGQRCLPKLPTFRFGVLFFLALLSPLYLAVNRRCLTPFGRDVWWELPLGRCAALQSHCNNWCTDVNTYSLDHQRPARASRRLWERESHDVMLRDLPVRCR